MTFEPALRRLASQSVGALGIRNMRVQLAMSCVPRHWFVDEALRARAYSDDALPIGYGQTISRMSTVARMTEALDPQGSDRVLEVGTGSGYQTAVLANLAAEVYSVERVAALALRARSLLHQLGVCAVQIRAGDGALGWAEAAPFQCILVTAAAREVPQSLLDQLAVGGRLVLPLGDGGAQTLRRVLRVSADAWEEEILEACRFVPLVREGENRAPRPRC